MLNNKINHVNSCALFRWNKLHVKNFFLITFQIGDMFKEFEDFFLPSPSQLQVCSSKSEKKMGGRPGRYSATLEKFVYFYIAHKNQFLTDYIIQIVLDCELQLSPYMYNRTCSSGFHLYNYYFVSQASLQVQIVAVFPILSGNQLSSIIIDNHDEICQ